MVSWNDEAPIAALASPRAGTVEGVNPDPRPGTHSTSGFLMAQGPSIPAEYQGRARLVDVAPTVLHLAGVPHAPDLEGTAWQAPSASGSLSRR
jgi:hypothetical protein